jgi:diguanylate cyclase
MKKTNWRQLKENDWFFCALAVSLVILFYSLLIGYTKYSFEKKFSEAAALHLKRIVSLSQVEQEKIFEKAYLLLDTFGREEEEIFSFPDRCRETAKRIVGLAPDFHTLGVASLEGKVICDSLPFEGEVDVSDRDYIQRAINNKEFSIGNYQIGRVTGKPSLNFGYPVLSEEGEVRRVLIASLGLDWLNPFIEELDLPVDSDVFIFDRDGKVLYNYFNRDQVGKFGLEAPLFAAILAKTDGTATITTDDGVEKVFAFTPIRGEQMPYTIIALGVPKEAIFSKYGIVWQKVWLAHIAIALFLLWAVFYSHYRHR